mmetsp:Transcript_30762/g.65852  ORF Transcript_30762/g.65852 Transcript_30762/m.65852 type:complete len:106 (+) Transcript_30762:110-427(+)
MFVWLREMDTVNESQFVGSDGRLDLQTRSDAQSKLNKFVWLKRRARSMRANASFLRRFSTDQLDASFKLDAQSCSYLVPNKKEMITLNEQSMRASASFSRRYSMA